MKTPGARPERATSPPFWETLCFFCAALLTAFLIQQAAGARSAAFGGFPDEPAHYLGGLAFRDYLAQAFGQPPLHYALTYYTHLPYIGLGVWPPVFYLLEGTWMLLAGVSRGAVLWLVAGAAAGLATSLFFLLRLTASRLLSAAAAAIFLFIPIVQWSICLVMVDLTCSLFALIAIAFFARYLEREQARDAILFGLFCGIAMLTKNSTYFILLVPPVVIAATGRWRLLKRWEFWSGAILVACLYVPWLLLSKSVLFLGMQGLQLPGLLGTLRLCLITLWQQTTWIFPIGIAGAVLLIVRYGRAISPIACCTMATLPAISVAIFAARVPVQPRLLLVAYIALIFFAVQLLALLPGARTRTTVMVAALLIFAAANWMRFDHPPLNRIHAPVSFVQAHDGGSPGAVLVPSQGEGAWIAEFAQFEPRRPERILVRPTKLFGEENWNGTNWTPFYQSAREIETVFQNTPVKYCILGPRGVGRQYPHDRLLETVVASNPVAWHEVFTSGAGTAGQYRVYENQQWTPAAENAVYHTMSLRMQKRLPSP